MLSVKRTSLIWRPFSDAERFRPGSKILFKALQVVDEALWLVGDMDLVCAGDAISDVTALAPIASTGLRTVSDANLRGDVSILKARETERCGVDDRIAAGHQVGRKSSGAGADPETVTGKARGDDEPRQVVNM